MSTFDDFAENTARVDVVRGGHDWTEMELLREEREAIQQFGGKLKGKLHFRAMMTRSLARDFCSKTMMRDTTIA